MRIMTGRLQMIKDFEQWEVCGIFKGRYGIRNPGFGASIAVSTIESSFTAHKITSIALCATVIQKMCY
ncbi:hypothetical protein D3C78_1758430 [compost metagenome]